MDVRYNGKRREVAEMNSDLGVRHTVHVKEVNTCAEIRGAVADYENMNNIMSEMHVGNVTAVLNQAAKNCVESKIVRKQTSDNTRESMHVNSACGGKIEVNMKQVLEQGKKCMIERNRDNIVMGDEFGEKENEREGKTDVAEDELSSSIKARYNWRVKTYAQIMNGKRKKKEILVAKGRKKKF